MSVCVCVCVCEGEKEREREREYACAHTHSYAKCVMLFHTLKTAGPLNGSPSAPSGSNVHSTCTKTSPERCAGLESTNHHHHFRKVREVNSTMGKIGGKRGRKRERQKERKKERKKDRKRKKVKKALT